jgi:putative phage-type endonuclease
VTSAAIAEDLPYEILCDTDDEPEWLSQRFAGIGASEVGCLVGMDHRSSPLKLFLEKTGVVQPEDLSDIEAIRWGHRMEPVIAAEFRERTGRVVIRGRKGRYCVLRSKAHPWALASLDFWTGPGANDPVWPLEVKNANAFRAEDWLNGTPDYHIAQLHQQMLVTGSARATSAVCIGGNKLAWCDVERDETLIRKLIFAGEKFWQRVQLKDPPEPDGSQATREVLAKLYPASDGKTVVLPAALEDAIYEWRRMKAAASANDKEIRRLEHAIQATLGESERGVIPSTGDEVSWKSQSVKEHTVKASSFRVLRFHQSKRI